MKKTALLSIFTFALCLAFQANGFSQETPDKKPAPKPGAQGDVIRGGPGNDVLRGGRGADDIRGGSGDDVIRGGPGRDRLEGGTGSDEIFADGTQDRAGRADEDSGDSDSDN